MIKFMWQIEKLPNEIIYLIVNYLTMDDIILLYKNNKINCNFIKIKKIVEDVYFMRLYMHKYYKLLNKYCYIYHQFAKTIFTKIIKENKKNIKILNHKNKYIGGTDYIDNIAHDDIYNNFMISIDPYKRLYIVIILKKKNVNKSFILCIFQRYTNDSDNWRIIHDNNSYDRLLFVNYLFKKSDICFDMNDLPKIEYIIENNYII